ncbi:MAG: PaaI family thioesterase [Myxococcota bacterium]|nr:PaaI family thioesterase [Myxococcota bacterium]
MTVGELNRFLSENFNFYSVSPYVESLSEDHVTVVLPYAVGSLRPGGTIAGPALMALADTVAYVAILNHDVDALGALTTQLNINFLTRPAPGDLKGYGQPLKLGRRLAVVRVCIEDERGVLVAEASVTYSMP